MRFGSLVGCVVATLVVLAVIAAIVMGLGLYNVAADAPHTAVVRSLIGFARERSIDARAEGIKSPPLDRPEMIAEGAGHYAAMCTGCHLAPGMPDNEMRPGMNPRPPALAAIPAENPAEQFWAVKHGIKMTGMPAWGVTHSDAEIWNIVAFLQKLPDMPPERYRTLTRSAGSHREHMRD